MRVQDRGARSRVGSSGGSAQQHIDRMARGRTQRSMRDELAEQQLVKNDPEQWQRHTAMHMLRDFENSGVDADLEELRAGWATNNTAVAHRQKRDSLTFDDGFADEYWPAMLDQTELNRRGDIAARRVNLLSGLRKAAESPQGSKSAETRLALVDTIADLGTSGRARPRRQRPSTGKESELDRILGRGVQSQRDSDIDSSVAHGHARRWRGPLDNDSDEDVQSSYPSSSRSLALLPENPQWRNVKAPPTCVSPDDPWGAWESRWADAFRDMENRARAKQQAEFQREEQERRRLWEEADRLREEDVRRQQERKASRASGPARNFGDGAYKSTSDGAGSWSSANGTSSRRPTNNANHSRSHEDNRGSGAPGSGPKPKSSPTQPSRPAPVSQIPDVPRFANFAAFEQAWSTFEVKVKGEAQLAYTDIPWPLSLPSVSGAATTDAPAERKKKLRGALLRWHPDKWAPLFARVKEADKVKVTEQIKEVTRRILDEKERLG